MERKKTHKSNQNIPIFLKNGVIESRTNDLKLAVLQIWKLYYRQVCFQSCLMSVCI